MEKRYIVSFMKALAHYRSSCNRKMKKFQLTQNETYLLIFLLRNPEINTAKEISGYIGMSKSLICRATDSLVRHGYLEAVRDEKDHRVYHLMINRENEELCRALKDWSDGFSQTLVEGILPEELVIFQRVLDHMIENLNHKKEE